MGGTFDGIHAGHRALLRAACEIASDLYIGLTSDAMVEGKAGEVSPYEDRRRALEAYLADRGVRYHIVPLSDHHGPSVDDEDLEAIVVTPETAHTAEEINRIRTERGFRPLELVVVPLVLARDFRPISSTRIRRGEIDSEGALRRALSVRVGSTNPVKVKAVRDVLSRFYDALEVEGVAVASGVPEQPRGKEVLRGAVERAKAARGEGDLGIGIEAGVFRLGEEEATLDVQYCAMADATGWVTVGHGSGFAYPPEVVADLEAGRTVSEAMERVTGLSNIGQGTGAIGYLTGGVLERRELTAQAVMAAFVPRVRPELYRPPRL
jgi:inosine/xanthosine triphosphatase